MSKTRYEKLHFTRVVGWAVLSAKTSSRVKHAQRYITFETLLASASVLTISKLLLYTIHIVPPLLMMWPFMLGTIPGKINSVQKRCLRCRLSMNRGNLQIPDCQVSQFAETRITRGDNYIWHVRSSKLLNEVRIKIIEELKA
ncbi:hypothetical protein [Citrobacter meridianamericanus]|uniref:Uncharacterized protein n=1 Tax=Citrobacter meridianamericanus TaxID=2894201 RepID=A0ABT1B6W7_9ENTR|nr:hypothetical protein [Citrobacter meridianamericanus]MCO5781606.1 hypothetical protein [Citrobacter meridianamericanus]